MPGSRLIETFKENERDLVRFLMGRLRSAFAAQDVVQDVYVKLCRLDDETPVCNRRAYLFQMAANLATDHMRREARQAALLDEAAEFLGGGVDSVTPEQALIARDELERLERAMAELPPLSRKIFHLSRFEEKSHREIARIVGLSPTAVFKHIRNVVDHLSRVRDS